MACRRGRHSVRLALGLAAALALVPLVAAASAGTAIGAARVAPPGASTSAAADARVAANVAAPAPIAAALAALHCNDVSGNDVQAVLAHAPAPRIILIKGTLPALTLDSLAHFLSGMGYPLARIADPGDGSLSHSGYDDSARLAGEVAWYVEHDGMPPMLIGHSRGGMVVIRTLHELAGAFHAAIAVHDPVHDATLGRTDVLDPRTGARRPVVGGVQVDFAAAIATGKLPRIWQGQWNLLRLLRRIPDSAIDFTGFHIEGDLVSGDALGIEPYAAINRAHVRNVVLPASYSHTGAVDTAHLAADPAMRAWIDAWRPDATEAPLPPGDTRNLGLATELWFGVKRAWCRAAQRLAAAAPHEAAAPREAAAPHEAAPPQEAATPAALPRAAAPARVQADGGLRH
jgi:hypothetical protein